NEIDMINPNSEEIVYNTARLLQVNKEKIRGRGRGKGRKSRKGGNNIVSERKAQISAQLPIPPNFNYLKHNIPFHQDFIRLPSKFSDNNISLYGLIRLFFP
ncbi:4474_t:CDS:1, partial [Gigaspora margarita]